MANETHLSPVAFFRSPIEGKFGVPRQAGLAPSIKGEIVFEEHYRKHPEALRGIEEFDYLWLIWGFNLSRDTEHLTVRPPRLGGNKRVGVFASRSPFRPNHLGLSCVKVECVDKEKGTIGVRGADLSDGTPIYDIKPYISYTDSHAEAKGGFTDTTKWNTLKVEFPKETEAVLSNEDKTALEEVLSQDPRPHFHNDPSREYGMIFKGCNVKFTVDSDSRTLKVRSFYPFNLEKEQKI